MNKEEISHQLRIKLMEKVADFEQMIQDKRSSNNETKSSMGDKYETGREMLQQEINQLQMQLNRFLSMLERLQTLNLQNHHRVMLGSLVETDRGLYFLSVSFGEMSFKNKKIFTISEETPLAKALMGKSKGETFIVNNISQIIKSIW